MKKSLLLVLALCLALLLNASPTLAEAPLPAPISGGVVMGGVSVGGVEITIKNVDTGAVMLARTDDTGQFIADLSGFGGDVPYVFSSRGATGDAIEVKFLYNDLAYSKSFVLETNTYCDGVRKVCSVWFDDSSAKPPVTEYVCYDGSKVSTPDLCPEKEFPWLPVVLTAVSVVIIGLGALYAFNKSKFKWAKGMAGIINYQKKELEKSVKAKDKAAVEKKKNTLIKTTKTITEKYFKGR